MLSRIFLFTVVIMVSGCSSEHAGDDKSAAADSAEDFEITEASPVDEAAIRAEVEGLTADFRKISFLRQILTEDQRVRQEEANANQNYGYNSVEHKKAQQNIIDLDAENLRRIDIFTEAYGEPKVNSVGRMQAEATWLVVHHSPGIDVKEEYYPVLYSAWKNELISGTNLTLYLNSWYEKVSGERHVMQGSYTEDQEIKELLDLLGLEPQ